MITRKRLAAGVCGLLAALTVGLGSPHAAAADEPAAKPPPRSSWSSTSAARCGPATSTARPGWPRRSRRSTRCWTPCPTRSSSAYAPSAPTTAATTGRSAARTPGSSTRSARSTAPRRRPRWRPSPPPAGRPIGPALLGAADDLEGGDAHPPDRPHHGRRGHLRPARPLRGGAGHRRQGHPPHHRHPRPGAGRQDPQAAELHRRGDRRHLHLRPAHRGTPGPRQPVGGPRRRSRRHPGGDRGRGSSAPTPRS